MAASSLLFAFRCKEIHVNRVSIANSINALTVYELRNWYPVKFGSFYFFAWD